MDIWLNFYLFLIFMKIDGIYNSECIPNNEYANFKVSNEELKICRSQKCYLYLEYFGKYDGCQFSNKRIQNRFIIKKYTKHFHEQDTIKSMKCDSNSDGVWKHDDCELVQSLVFKPPKIDPPYDVFVLSCAAIPGIHLNTDGELPFADNPRFQILNFDYIEAYTAHVTKVPPALKIQCVAQCQEFKSLAKMDTWLLGAECEQSTCYVVWENIIRRETLFCGPKDKQVILKFRQIVTFDIKIISISVRTPRFSERFDAGEFISCDVKDADTDNDQYLPTSKLIAYIYFGRFRNDNVEDKLARQIPEYADNPFEVTCYMGNVRNYGIKHRYLSLKQIQLPIAMNILTTISSATGNIESKGEYALNYPLATRLTCDRKKFTESQQINTFLLDKPVYPLSEWIHFPDVIIETEKQPFFSLTKYTGAAKKLRFLSCYVPSLSLYSVPVMVFTADRPSVSWWFINPPWESEFQMQHFMIACTGENILRVAATCDDCPKNVTLVNIVVIKSTVVSIEVTEFVSIYDHYTITCTGFSNYYPDVSIKKTFIVVEPINIGLNKKVKVYELNRDSVGCYAQFNFYDGRARIMTIPVMIMIQYNDTITYASTNSPEVTISSFDKYPSFKYCCPYFKKNIKDLSLSKYICGNLFKLRVASSIQSVLTPNEGDIYVGDFIKCHLCVTYTDARHPSECTGKNRIETLMNAIIVYPNKTTKYYYSFSEVEMPNVEVNKRTKKYYDPSDYSISYACLTKLDDKRTTYKPIYLRSCNNNPPPIYIMPRGKTLFEVGEIFSCSTSSDSCKDLLKYNLSIARGLDSRSINLLVNSYKFLRTDLGNDIVIRCSAGTKVNFAEDRRVVRVEVHPFNISILNNHGLMFFKDYVSCECSGYPKPEILWKQLEGPTRLRISEGMVLVGPWDMTGFYEFECMAENKLGVLRANALFYLLNPRFRYNIDNPFFNLFIPISTAVFVTLILLSVFLTLQESIFGVPFFSSKKIDVKIVKKSKRTEIINMIRNQDFLEQDDPDAQVISIDTEPVIEADPEINELDVNSPSSAADTSKQ